MFEWWQRQLGPAMIITRREVRDQFRDWRIILPVAALTIFFPGLMNFTASQAVSFVEEFGAPIIGERLIPFLLMVVGFFPISISLVIALESFVGEKERHSIEPLLSSPLTDIQLYIGKLLAATIPPLLASYLGIIVYLVGVYFQVGWTPAPILLVQIILLTTVQAIVMVSGAVVISVQTTSVRAANLLASFIIIPTALLIQGESIVMFWGRYNVLWWAIIGLAVIAGLLMRTGLAHFNREEMLGRELDVLNLRWAWGIYWNALVDKAGNPLEWFRKTIWLARGYAKLAGVMLILLLVGLTIGAVQAQNFPLPLELMDWQNFDQRFLGVLGAMGFTSFSGVGYVMMHNLRVILLASILGVFSFGVLGVVVLMLPIMLLGYLMANLATGGLSSWAIMAATVLPHGLLEIPVMVLAGAAIIRLGATPVAPARDMSIGESVLRALADWTRILTGLILPLLLGAALIEVMLTPLLTTLVMGR